MTMTMTMTGVDHIVEIDHKTITEMTIEKKIIGRSKIHDRSRYRDYYGDICDDRYIDNCRNTYKDSYRDKYRDKYRDDSFDSDKGRSRENITYIMLEKIMVLLVTIQGLNDCTRSYNS